MESFLGELAAEVQSRLSRLKKKCKVITLKLKIREKSAPKETAKFLGKSVHCHQLLTVVSGHEWARKNHTDNSN